MAAVEAEADTADHVVVVRRGQVEELTKLQGRPTPEARAAVERALAVRRR